VDTMTDDKLAQGWLFHQRFGYAYDKIPPGLAFEAYGKALLQCANGDGELTDDERTWVVGYFAAFDSPQEVTDTLKGFDGSGDIEATISMGNTVADVGRRWLVWDALNACGADGPLSEGERKTVRRMSAKMGISEDLVRQIEELQRQETELNQKKLDLLWPDGVPAEYL